MQMNSMQTQLRRSFARPFAFTVMAALALPGCIDRDKPADEGGGGDGGGGTPGACSRLPPQSTTYKGGDTLGEELSLTLNPSTLAYTLRVDASLQRSAGTELAGTLVALDGCTYASDESGAVFTIGANGVVHGGVREVVGSGFVPMIAFASQFENSADPTRFNDIAAIFNTIGAQTAGSVESSYGGSGRIRNAGTFQLCQDAANGGFMVYDAACAQTAKGYLSYNGAHAAFDVYTTPASGGAVTTGGTLSGSMIIGMVGSTAVPLQLIRESASRYGLLLYTAQSALVAGDADGSYTSVDSDGINGTATWSGTSLNRNGAAATLSYDSPVSGVAQATGAFTGYLLQGAGLYGFVPGTTAAAQPSFELGLRQ
ncbi:MULTISPECIES: hypothetical protein [Hydrocarboniphaga]|uniref:Transferrin-binding protein B C-lobe/N-lobe beta barrel domain-containing protein n=1 Tax=Hydrocarboniphaga effusa AP103 TaxID=1172194 RepID=I8T2Z7_9GAMM|nr:MULTISPECIES: hypothetical protein [Hydrocarboniphaga]EIT68315.1 hypothetical protein WQQ_35100 [Hydrocarboniphaga effusa AP103]MDZ4078701.1 hypothetical protein [Hydrocarboniphaga sp.]